MSGNKEGKGRFRFKEPYLCNFVVSLGIPMLDLVLDGYRSLLYIEFNSVNSSSNSYGNRVQGHGLDLFGSR
jgi:hypothetical protein